MWYTLNWEMMEVTQGECIRMLREEKQMTLEDVAKQIGVSRATIFKYEKGAIENIPNDKIEALAKLFNVSKAFLKGWSDSREDVRVGTIDIAVPDGERFAKAYSVMPEEDRIILVGIFQRAYEKLEEMENAHGR